MNSLATSRTICALGGKVTIQAEGPGSEGAVDEACELVMDLQRRLTRFEEESELCRLNRDPRRSIPASPLMLRFAEAVRFAGEQSAGLVDATLLDEVEAAGYVESIDPDAGILPRQVDSPPVRPRKTGSWSDVALSRERHEVIRPPGLRLDSGGIGKGLAADIVAERLADFETWAVECSGDLRFGGTRGAARKVNVTSPITGRGVIAEYEAASGAIATSGTTRRSWDSGGDRSHHLIDPRTGRPADTGVIQATAVAPTALEAEVRAKSALLWGPAECSEWLPDGGVIVTRGLEVMSWGFRTVEGS